MNNYLPSEQCLRMLLQMNFLGCYIWRKVMIIDTPLQILIMHLAINHNLEPTLYLCTKGEVLLSLLKLMDKNMLL